ncbi:helix-turn-helix domain-containing protein [Streptomyces sp. SID13666]|uniref:helix-turn-helix domain-containing protein n=1 Tax=unclassified Streptomyces TaxID=2593676 RepID=UPI0013C03F80|nr:MULTISPECIES: helix-turn-helix transcriptional regulator [unclassified Streptomyces]NEA58103.1 helix-turn-helix domain-containing protein [Streptomyces sp. SID13666]NEA74107.1 helix-turn-helix domain-containing protein [Streptomyces sp. SID13588]
MPPRSYPTARQQRLGAELRKLREQAGMTGSDAAAFLGGERAQISHIESGRYGVSGERVRRLATHYSANDKKLVEALVAMAEERGKGWWAEYRGVLAPSFLDLAELEHHATFLRTVHMLHMPGLLQSEQYARALFSGGITELSPSELDARVEHRLRRRAILERPAPPKLDVVIHESALRLRYAARKVMRGQLDLLLEASEWPAVDIHVIPFDVDELTGSAQPMLYAGGTVPQLDTVQIDAAYGSGFLDVEAQLDNYRVLFRLLSQVALGAEESRRFIHSIAREM